jgi:radical SAM family uncharacterized protein
LLNNKLELILPRVERPARYTGGELNAVYKDPASVDVRFAFAFPDVYEIGMSHLGTRILYDVLNRSPHTWCERVFAPWADMEKEMRDAGIPLFALESGDSVSSFDIVGFTLQYEMSYTNILNMLDLSGLKLKSAERGEGTPLVIAGGPCAFNPEPLWEFIDCFVLGDGEEAICDIADVYGQCKKEGRTKSETLLAIAAIRGVYVPSYYDVLNNQDGTVNAIVANKLGIPAVVEKRIIDSLDAAPWPEKPIVPFLEIVHDRLTLEIFRGCTRGCRFCQAGMVYRPVRERSVETLLKQAAEGLKASGYDEISLSSLSSGDYSRFAELVSALRAGPCLGHISLSLPSLRLDAHGREYMESLEGGRRTGLTLAPEAGTQRLRDVINKNVTEEDLLSSVRDAFEAGWDKVKLYFMIGLPGETDDDLYGIADLARKVLGEYYKLPKEKRRRGVNIVVSTSNFVPKPHTPFQWKGQDGVEELRRKQQLLKGALSKMRGIDYSWHDAGTSMLEAAFARGGRSVSKVLLRAWELGCKFDSWREHFSYSRWMQAFQETGTDAAFYANREMKEDEVLPWDHLSSGVSKQFLRSEYERAMSGATTGDCRDGCLGCGLAGKCGGSI